MRSSPSSPGFESQRSRFFERSTPRKVSGNERNLTNFFLQHQSRPDNSVPTERVSGSAQRQNREHLCLFVQLALEFKREEDGRKNIGVSSKLQEMKDRESRRERDERRKA